MINHCMSVVDKMTVHSLVLYGVATCVRSLEFTTGVILGIPLE